MKDSTQDTKIDLWHNKHTWTAQWILFLLQFLSAFAQENPLERTSQLFILGSLLSLTNVRVDKM